MVQCISSVIRRMVVAFGADNLLRYLQGHIRADFLKKLKLRDMLTKNAHIAASAIKRPMVMGDIIEDLIDMFIDDNMGPKALGLLIGHARERGLDAEDSKRVVHGGSLSPELVAKVGEWQDEFGKILYDFLNKSFKNRALEWAVKKKREEPEDVIIPSQGERETEEGETEGEPENVGLADIGDEHEIEREIEQGNAWQRGLIEDIEGMLDREIGDEKKRTLYKVLLKDRILGDRKLSQLVKEYGISIGSLHNYEKDLMKRLEILLKGKGLGPKFDLSDREVEVPDYRVLLRDNKELQVDLKGWLKSENSRSKSDFTMQILDLYAEGKTPVEIAEVLKGNKKVIENTKTRYFNKDYADWYRDHVESVRKAGMIQAVIGSCTIKYRSERE